MTSSNSHQYLDFSFFLYPGVSWDQVNVFLVSGTELYFEFRMRIMLITCWQFSYAVLTQSRGLFSFPCCPASKEGGRTQETGRGHSQDSWPQLIWGIFHPVQHHTEQWNCEYPAVRGWVLIRGCWAVALRIICFVDYFTIIIIFLYFSVLLFLTPPTNLTFSSNSLPCPSAGEWANSYVVFSC